MDEQLWAHYLRLLASHESILPRLCVGCWYERHPAEVAFPGDRVSSTLCGRHRITLPGEVKPPETLRPRRSA